MAGLNDRRKLGTESGRIRRAARMVERGGGNSTALLNLAAQAKLSEGSAITSAEENAAAQDYNRRMQSGLLQERRAALGGDSRQAFDADLDRSASVKTDSAARQRAYDRGATLGVSREDIDKRAGTLPGTVPVQTGTTPQSSTGVPPLLARPADRPTLMGPPTSAKPGLIDGKPARSVLDSMRGQDTEPGNLAGLTNRDAVDREAAVNSAISESAGNPSVTRQGVIDRLNKERVATGRQPFGEDIYKDIAGQDGERSQIDNTKERLLGKAKGIIEAQTPLQKSLADAKNRFAPPAENTSSGFQGGLPVPAPPDTSNLQVPPSLFGGTPPDSARPSASVKPLPIGTSRLNARFSPGLLTQRPTIKADRTAEEEDYKKRYKSTPDLPVFPVDSLANRLYKSTLTRYTR